MVNILSTGAISFANPHPKNGEIRTCLVFVGTLKLDLEVLCIESLTLYFY